MRTEPVLFIKDQERRRGEQFDEDVGQGDFLPAIPASSPEEEIRNDGNIVVEMNPLLTALAGRRRMEKAHPPGDTVDHDVQKAAPGQPKKRDDDYLFQGMTAVLTSPV